MIYKEVNNYKNMLKSQRFTNKYLNQTKFKKLSQVDNEVKALKNKMSQFCFNHLEQLYTDKNFQVNYKNFKTKYLNAQQTQTLFQDIIKYYNNTLQQRIKSLDLSVQVGMKITYYKKDTKNKHKGDLKQFKLLKKKTRLTGFVKYLVYCDLDTLSLKPQLQILYDYYTDKNYLNRILNLVKEIKNRIKQNIKQVQFTTGTHRKAFNYTGLANKQGVITQYNGFIKDQTNTKYKHWFKYKLNQQYVYLPVQINQQFSKFDKINKSQYFIKLNKYKVDIIGTYEAQNPDFKDYNECVGVDLNIKHNFCSISNSTFVDYDRQYIKEFCRQLKKLDKIGLKNINNAQKKHLNKLVKRNQWYFKKLVSQVLDKFQAQNITDVVMQDLDKFSKSFVNNQQFEVKYSRLTRLLRLNNIANWFKSQAQKRGIRVHLTTPRYSSQQCPVCGCVDQNNRQTQEHFKCTCCGNQNNADLNAAINLRKRFTSNVLKTKLHSLDKFKRLLPKKLKKQTIKQILMDIDNNLIYLQFVK